jgi:hypothetical protein
MVSVLTLAGASLFASQEQSDSMLVLDADAFKHHIDFFNTMEPENIVNAVPNERSWEWISENIPFFECPDKSFEQIYYYRWWTFRKHLKETPDGFVFTEFLDQIGHSGKYNTISCALGHHIYEGTWLHDKRYIDQYARFWYTGNEGSPQPHFHKYSNWGTWALYRRYLVNRDEAFVVSLLEAFIRDYQAWTAEQGLRNGLCWQYDTRDGMEESISGSRKLRNARPPLNSYMYANAVAISKVAQMVGKAEVAREYAQKAAKLRSLALSRGISTFRSPAMSRRGGNLRTPKDSTRRWGSPPPSADILVLEVTASARASGTAPSGPMRRARRWWGWRTS